MNLLVVSTFLCFILWMSTGQAIFCGRRQFACANGRQCIPSFRFCDGRAHCRDRSDEWRPGRYSRGVRCRKGPRICHLNKSYAPRAYLFCRNSKKDSECGPDTFKCKDGSACIKLSDYCNGKKDCRDGSDEQKRNVTRNAEEERPCKRVSNVCVLPPSLTSKREDICDKDYICWDDEFKCEHSNKCIPWHWFCDGDTDCKDGSDEISLPSNLPGIACHRIGNSCLLPETYKAELFCQREVSCLDGEFKCRDGTQCIPERRFCSGHTECRDGSDEFGVRSGVSGIFCRRGRNICVLPEERKDIQENFCLPESECREDEFACLDGSQCIPWRQYCDGMRGCRDGSDEINVNSTLPGVTCRRNNFLCVLPEKYSHMVEEVCREESKCSDDEYPCLSGTQCIPKQQFCDGSYDCRDLSDEIDPKKNKFGIPCYKDRRTCVLPSERSHLYNGMCSEDSTCISRFQCSDRTQCIPKDWFCDGVVHCSDGSDEINAGSLLKKKSYSIRCRVGKNVCLLPATQAFKRNRICYSDREVRCRPDEFQCSDGSKCLKPSWFCDGEAYCSDKSDSVISKMSLNKGDIRCRYEEHICVLPMKQSRKKKTLCRKDPVCQKGEYSCLDGSRCLPGRNFCDGYKDCSDGSDEISPISDVVGITCRGVRNSWIYSGRHQGLPGGNWCILPELQRSKKTLLCR